MDKASGKVVRTEADWAALVDKCGKSGQSVAVFCRGEGISYALFLYHRGKILKKRRGVQSIARSSGGVSILRNGSFIPVRVDEGVCMRFRFPTGLVLESEETLPASWVVEVARRWEGTEDAQ